VGHSKGIAGFGRALATAAAATALIAGLAGGALGQARTKVSVYTSLENDQLGPFKQAIEAAVPSVEIAWVRDSTGVMTARLIAEKDNPRADMIMGIAASSLALFDTMGMLAPYTPKGVENLKAQFRDAKSPTSWVGMDAYLSVVCFNTVEGGKKNAPKPASWQDLTNPAYKGQIVMPNPASSGTGYLTVAAWLQVMGEANGWKFMDALHENIGVYTHSGSAPCVQAARGERLIGIGFDMRGAREKTQGAPIDIILPKEGAGWEMEASGMVKGTKNAAAVQAVLDWSVSKGANELYGKYYAIVGHQGMSFAPPNYPAGAEQAMVKNDLAWMANNRDKILAEWTKRYDGKSAPKN
jgi:iron(III) transport system substrate-binding protein